MHCNTMKDLYIQQVMPRTCQSRRASQATGTCEARRPRQPCGPSQPGAACNTMTELLIE